MADRQILKVLVGSHAHGLATPESDYDYRGVYVTPTSQLLSLFAGKQKGTHWVEGENEDATAYEIGHFLYLAVRCNPSILEVFMAPIASNPCSIPLGMELRALFPIVWNPRDVANAFGGYSLNQRKKFFDNHLGRRWKFAVAYIRVLLQAKQLLETGRFSLEVPDFIELNGRSLPTVAYLGAVKRGAIGMGEVVEVGEELLDEVHDLASEGPFKGREPDLGKVDEFLLKVRKESW